MKEPSSVKEEFEFWRWREYHRVVPGKKWTSKDIITAGVDVGSVGSKAAIMVNGEAYSWGITRTGSNSPESAEKALDLALEGTGLKVKRPQIYCWHRLRASQCSHGKQGHNGNCLPR